MIWSIIAGAIKGNACDQAMVEQARTYALISAIETAIVGGDDRGHAHVVAVVEQLEQLLIGPGGALLRAQIIEY